MIARIKRLLQGGPVQLTFAERALKMTDHYKEFMTHATILRQEMQTKENDIVAAHLRIVALRKNEPPVP